MWGTYKGTPLESNPAVGKIQCMLKLPLGFNEIIRIHTMRGKVTTAKTVLYISNC